MSECPEIYIYKRIVQAKLYMDTYYHSSIDLNDISNEAFFSKFHFIRLFRRAYGKTPHQYLTWVRVEKAKELLQQKHKAGTVTFEVGFDSVTSFNGLFKRMTGKTPAAWQRAYQSRQKQIQQRPLQFVPACFASNYCG